MLYFDFLDFLTAQIMLPLGGLLIALFVGWQMPWVAVNEEMSTLNNHLRQLWIITLRFVSPSIVVVVMALKLMDTYKNYLAAVGG